MSERYTMRPAAGIGERHHEIFDTVERRTIASFIEPTGAVRTDHTARGAPDLHAVALDLLWRLNVQDQEVRQAMLARQQLTEYIEELGNAAVTQMAQALAAGGVLRVVVRR